MMYSFNFFIWWALSCSLCKWVSGPNYKTQPLKWYLGEGRFKLKDGPVLLGLKLWVLGPDSFELILTTEKERPFLSKKKKKKGKALQISFPLAYRIFFTLEHNTRLTWSGRFGLTQYIYIYIYIDIYFWVIDLYMHGCINPWLSYVS